MRAKGTSRGYPRIQKISKMCLILLALPICSITCTGDYNNETISEFLVKYNRLYDHLFSDYRKELPPVYSRARYTNYSSNISKHTVFQVTLYYAKLLYLNEPEQTITFIIEYDLTWYDARISWNASDWDDIEEIMVNREKIWVPDVLPYDSPSFNDPRDADQRNVYVRADGKATYFVTAVTTVVCPLDITNFPYDTQYCELNLISNNFLPTEMVICPLLYDGFDDSSTSNGVWMCEDVSVNHVAVSSNDTDWNYEVAKYIFTLRRSAYYYVVLIVIPSFIMTILCVIGIFWTKFDEDTQGEKLSLGYAAILAMAMVLQITDGSIPKTTQLPILSFYIIFNLMVVTTACFLVLAGSKISSSRFCLRRDSSKKRQSCLRIWISTRINLFCLIIFPLIVVGNLGFLVSHLNK